MSNKSKTPYQLLKSYFKIKSLKEIYNNKFSLSTTKGIDRLSGIQFIKQAKLQIKVINNKCLKGTYKFSPYLELLQSKGRGKAPRILAIPTIRDRVVLCALKEILFQIFPECVPRKLANTYVCEIKKFVDGRAPCEISLFRADIENFYGSIDREKLFIKLRKKIKSRKILTLLKRAVETPVVPNSYSRKDIRKYREQSQNTGIPQGLAISNILASIYLHEFDNDIRQNSCVEIYYRYVDDILIFTKKDKIDEINMLIEENVRTLNLKLNMDKTYKKGGEEEFEYLGYRFELPKVTIRASTIERFIHSVVAKFSRYIHNREKNLNKLKRDNYNIEKLKEIFVSELNEKITGAISENRRYGWIFYFNAINDISVLYMIDNIIANLFKRLDDFGRVPPPNLKKLSRAFYEAKHNPKLGYIHNYNNYKTVEHKRDFLRERGRLERDKGYSEEEINELYENLKQRNLSELERDDALLY
ncbi:reverse transcriptase domain-containing protein [Coleofasciculus sp. FACHB-501]|uniref:reverse transcriptase domain-containing protein n=1 Tax=Cyanophyceae TaxID=3028117 RepID=UPI001688B61D|nr:reverse transcriptase domain-containing protein [Coleofasciculus sp. FACHB-501]MBD1838310.1 RNA-directed DNA polymerase [Coleofasciculus sp. FACHB-501]